MNPVKTIALAALLAASAASANAATVYASQVLNFTPGTFPVVTPGRDDPNAALGLADGSFVSLGYGGSLTVGFGTQFESPGSVWEVTFGNTAAHVETADIEVRLGSGVWTLVASIINAGAQAGASFTFAGIFDQLRITDTTPNSSKSTDGFDVDSIGVSPVPLPAGGLLLLGGLGLLAARRRKAA